jgi:hypothetical protein
MSAMAIEKKQLSFEDIEAQTALELPDRETMLVTVVIRQYQGLWCTISSKSRIEGGRCLCQAMRKSPSVLGVSAR